jgi:predicted kinase
VPRLIHLNGPPAIGKSTLARMYVDQHPGVLNLDIDSLRRLIGGWRDDFVTSGSLVRPLAVCMAGVHLQGGHDVVMPQYLGRLSEIEKFEAAAQKSNADFVEILVMDSKPESLRRFTERCTAAEEPWHREVGELVEGSGGLPMLSDMYDRLIDVMDQRTDAVVVPSSRGAIEQTYLRVEGALRG